MPDHLVWVIGRSGMLGSALAAAHAGDRLVPSPPVPWHDVGASVEVLSAHLASLVATAAGRPWTVYWAAGAGVIGAGSDLLDRECAVLTGFVEALGGVADPEGGAFFHSSSASVYGGSSGTPFDESTLPVPMNLYAAAKLRQEESVRAALAGVMPHVVGRISTLYGPGQNLAKGQGLVSAMCLRSARRQPVELFVPIDTIRDYVYVADAAAVIRGRVAAARLAADHSTRVRVVARGQAATIAEMANRVRRVGRRRIGVQQAPALASTSEHVRDLRVATRYPEEIADVPWTPLDVGIDAVYRDVLRLIARASPSVAAVRLR